MTVNEIVACLKAQIYTCADQLHREVSAACGSDLMSDVLAFSHDRVLLLTGLVNPQVIRTAEMMDIRVISFVRGKSPTEEMASLAEEKSILLLSTEKSMFHACGALYAKGLGGAD